MRTWEPHEWEISMNIQRELLLFVTLTGAATPALAQTATAGVRARRRRNARCRIDPGLYPCLVPSGLALVRAAGIGSRPGDEPVARTPAARRRYRLAGLAADQGRREQLRPAGRRLQQSDLAAVGGGDREEVRRNLACRHHLSERVEPVLARTDAVHFQAYADADDSAAGQGHDLVQ